MALFQKEETVFEKHGIKLGALNYESSTGTGYDNVLTFPFPVKKNRKLRVEVVSDKTIDIVVADQKGCSVMQKQNITECILGPTDTGDNGEMGIIIGLYPGDKANVDLRAWTDQK